MKRIWQSIGVGVTMSLVEMNSHKLRSLLSIIGVMLGSAALVVIVTLIGGVDKYLNDKMAKWAGSAWFVDRQDASMREKIAWSRSSSLKFSDGYYLEKNAASIQYVYHTIERFQNIALAGQTIEAGIRGIDQSAFSEDLEDIIIIEGSQISRNDFNRGNTVCIIAWELADMIRNQQQDLQITNKNLIGKRCIINNVTLEIKGIYGPRDPENKPSTLRKMVLLPIKVMQKSITGLNPNPGSIRIRVKDPGNLTTQLLGIIPILKNCHRGVEDFDVNISEWIEEISEMLNNITLLMGIISTISLLVGGLSIMNVMLSSIAERIHEIGVRKALGAKKLQIFIQFITETVTLSCIGGIFGIFLGMIPLFFRQAIYRATDGHIEPTLYVPHLLIVFCLIVFLGISFGLYPAIKASKMNPIDALRYE